MAWRKACSPQLLRDTHDSATGTWVGFEFGVGGRLRFAVDFDFRFEGDVAIGDLVEVELVDSGPNSLEARLAQ